MTQDEIIKMANEVGINPDADTLCRYEGWIEPFKAFAKLVEAHTLSSIDPSKFMSYQEGIEVGRMADRVPLYTTPPKREWIGLTDEERINLSYKAEGNECVAVELTEAKLKAKNEH